MGSEREQVSVNEGVTVQSHNLYFSILHFTLPRFSFILLLLCSAHPVRQIIHEQNWIFPSAHRRSPTMEPEMDSGAGRQVLNLQIPSESFLKAAVYVKDQVTR